MNFDLTEEQQAVKDAAKDFAENVLLKGVIERDRDQIFPTDEVRQMGELGFLGMMVPPEMGGGGMNAVSYVSAITEIAKVDASAAVIMSVNNSLVCEGLRRFGSKKQQQDYLLPLANGKVIGAFCLSEPEAGSDATSQKTTAIKEGDFYRINGTKNWITNGSTASYYIVFAQTDASKKHKGINAFIIEKGLKGFTIGPKEDKMGIRGSDTHSLMFQDVMVSSESRIGEEGFGFYFAMKLLAGGRIGIAAQALGIAWGAYERSLQYAKERKTFGKQIMEHQSIANKLAEMRVKIESAELMCLKAAWLKDQNKDFSLAASMAKLHSSQIANEVTTEAVQIHGGYGYVREYHVERMMRDAKITQIYEGTSEIQKIVIARAISQ